MDYSFVRSSRPYPSSPSSRARTLRSRGMRHTSRTPPMVNHTVTTDETISSIQKRVCQKQSHGVS